MNISTTTLFKDFDVIKALNKQYPNDGDLGREVRKLYRFDEFVMAIPNDRELGAEIRKSVVNFSK